MLVGGTNHELERQTMDWRENMGEWRDKARTVRKPEGLWGQTMDSKNKQWTWGGGGGT